MNMRINMYECMYCTHLNRRCTDTSKDSQAHIVQPGGNLFADEALLTFTNLKILAGLRCPSCVVACSCFATSS